MERLFQQRIGIRPKSLFPPKRKRGSAAKLAKTLEKMPKRQAKSAIAHRAEAPVPDPPTRSKGGYWLVNCVGGELKMPAPETWEAIKKAATTAGTLISLRN